MVIDPKNALSTKKSIEGRRGYLRARFTAGGVLEITFFLRFNGAVCTSSLMFVTLHAGREFTGGVGKVKSGLRLL